MSFFRLLRITVLLTILVVVAGSQWLAEARFSGWEKPVWVTLYPVPGDSDASSLRYATSLDPGSFEEINRFLAREARRYGRSIERPVVFQVAPPLAAPPPAAPAEGNRFDIALWSLKMRWWAWRRDREDGLPSGDAQIFFNLHGTGADVRPERSVGVRKGMFGIVNGFASTAMAPQNRLVIAHEILHLFGASDKYDPLTGQPSEPEGLAEPGARPLYPQQAAEIMGGRIARSRVSATMPPSLGACVVGEATAREIGWL